jgi:hypothetical protein
MVLIRTRNRSEAFRAVLSCPVLKITQLQAAAKTSRQIFQKLLHTVDVWACGSGRLENGLDKHL